MTFFRSLWNGLTVARNVAANLFFVLILILLLTLIFGGSSTPQLPARFALELQLAGSIVERATPLDPIGRLLGRGVPAETVLGDVERMLENAASDDRVGTLVLNTSNLQAANMVQIERLGAAINAFKRSGKSVLASGAYFSQPQYLIASYADALYLHPYGETLLTGLGSYQPYFAGLLKKLNVDVHVFRVGKFKSAVEPFLLDSMSPEAAAAGSELLGQLWSSYRRQIADNRGLEETDIDNFINGLAVALESAAGDVARLAVEARLVDELLTPDAFAARIADEVDVDADDLERIDNLTYLASTGINASNALPASGAAVALITATGAITNAVPEQMSDGIVAAKVIELIQQAKDDDDVRSLVMHVDSPGGEVLASELIRRELELVQLAGKPVVVAMGGVAASGGYWISATADKIIASPDTITGSIGIFGVLPSINKALTEVGVNIDGVGTHSLSGGMSITRPLSDEMSGIIQSSVNQGYHRFITLVARGRDLERSRVEEIAQGRVWSGAQALELGLVDELGNLQDALDAAAGLAGLAPGYRVEQIDPPLTARELLLQQLGGAQVLAGVGVAPFQLTNLGAQQIAAQLPGGPALVEVLRSGAGVTRYALCERCDLTW